VAALHGREGGELIHFPTGLHTEMPDGLEGYILGQYADIKYASAFDQFLRQILRLAGDGDPGGITCHLHAGIDDAAVVFFILRRQHEQAVA